MRKILMVLGVILMAGFARVEVVSAQTLPGDGNCWTCVSIENGSGGYDPQCLGTQTGAYYCHFEYYYPSTVCWTEGTGCTTSLADASGLIEEVVPCNTIGVGAPAWWGSAIIGGSSDQNDNNARVVSTRTPLLATFDQLFEIASS